MNGGGAGLRRIVSGAQTGADRAALDVALGLGLACGGWVPSGRTAEDGSVDPRYPGLRESVSADPAVRTRLNVRDSDATLLLTRGAPTGGSALTLEVARRLGRPVLHLDLAELTTAEAARRAARWIEAERPAVLNVAGPRASKDPAIYHLARAVLAGALLALDGVPTDPVGRRAALAMLDGD